MPPAGNPRGLTPGGTLAGAPARRRPGEAMAILRDEDREPLRAELERELKGDVTMTLVGPSALSPPPRDLTPQIRELYEEIAALSPRLKLEWIEVPTGTQREALGLAPDDVGPLTILTGAARGRVRYLGAPAGYEFPGLLRALAAVSSGDSGLSAASRAALARVATRTHVRVFFTPT